MKATGSMENAGAGHARNVSVDGTARVCDVVTLQSVDVEAWGKWCVGTVKPFHGCFQGTLSSGRDQLSSSRLRSK